MKNTLAKEIDEFKNKEEHLNENIGVNESSTSHLNKLIELSNRTASGFSIKGALLIVEIKFGKFNRLFASLFLIFLSFFILGAAKNMNDPILVSIPFIILTIGILNAKFWSVINKITLNCDKRLLIIENNHWLGKYLGGKKNIPFSEILTLEKKLKKSKGKNGITYKRHRIILKTKQKKYQLFEIPYGPMYYVNENSMMNSINGIIKNAT